MIHSVSTSLRASVSRLVAVLSILVLLQQSVVAQLPQPPSPSGSPAQIHAAGRIFLTNAGAQTGFPYDSSVAYQQFADDLRAWGRYTLAEKPADADLIFEIRSAAPLGGIDVQDGTGGSYRFPQLQLTILDRETQTRLWVLSEPVYSTQDRKDRTDWFSVAVTNLTTKVKQLAGEPVSSFELSELNEVPRAPHHRWVYAVVFAPVALGIGGGILLHHEFENSLNDQKTQQDAFCTANHIPLSMCAGG